MKLSEWARRNGVDRHTASRWFHAGCLPVPARQLPTGTIIVEDVGLDVSAVRGGAVLYARVSSSDQKPDLERQLGRLVAFAAAEGLTVSRVVQDIGSAMNGRRPKLLAVLADPSVSVIVVEHRDRLTQFGFEFVQAALSGAGRRIVVMDDTEVEDDLVRDMTEVLTSFCARLSGRRSAARRASAALLKAQQEPSS